MKFKEKLKKYRCKYIPVLCTLLLIPCISFNVFALTPTYPQYVLSVDKLYSASHDKYFNRGDDGMYMLNEYIYYTSAISVALFDNGNETDTFLNFPKNPELYDYYIYTSISSCSQPTADAPFIADGIYFTDGTGNVQNVISDVQYFYNVYESVPATSAQPIEKNDFVAKLNVTDDMELSYIVFTFPADGGTYKTLFDFTVFLVPKGDAAALDNIVTAINNQTDIIENGNEQSQEAVSDFNTVLDEFNSQLEQIEEFDDLITDEFTSANEQYLTELNNFSLSGSLLNAGNWLSTSMQTVYDNSSDYKMLWLVPLLFGIPVLIFVIRRGS